MPLLRLLTALVGATLAGSVLADVSGHSRGHGAQDWNSKRFKNFIVFGDSYSDESRLNYFAGHNGTLPPPGTVLPEVDAAALRMYLSA